MRAFQIQAFGLEPKGKMVQLGTLTPGPDELRIEVKASGLNPVDGYIHTGHYALKPQLPYVPGFDGAGIIREIGSRVQGWQPGQRVFFSSPHLGSCAEEILVPNAMVAALPVEVSFAEGAALGIPYATAYAALFHRAKVEAEDTVLIHGGSGAVGLAAIQWLGNPPHGKPVRMVVTGGQPEGLEHLMGLSGVEVINHREPHYLSRLQEIAPAKGFDVILEMNAHLRLGQMLPLLAPHGRIVIIGSRGETTINPRDLMVRQASLTGVSLLQVPLAERQKIQRKLSTLLTEGSARPWIGARFPLEEAARAFQRVAQGGFGKTILEHDPNPV